MTSKVKPPAILVLTGASGSGKTATARAVEASAPSGVRCHYLDSAGLPSLEEIRRDFGGPEQGRGLSPQACRPRVLRPEATLAHVMPWHHRRGRSCTFEEIPLKTASIRVADDLWDSVRTKAHADRLSANAVVVKALEAYLRARPPQVDREHVRRLAALVGVVEGGPVDLADTHDEVVRSRR